MGVNYTMETTDKSLFLSLFLNTAPGNYLNWLFIKQLLNPKKRKDNKDKNK